MNDLEQLLRRRQDALRRPPTRWQRFTRWAHYYLEELGIVAIILGVCGLVLGVLVILARGGF